MNVALVDVGAVGAPAPVQLLDLFVVCQYIWPPHLSGDYNSPILPVTFSPCTSTTLPTEHNSNHLRPIALLLSIDVHYNSYNFS